MNELPKEFAELVEVHNTNKSKEKVGLLLTLTEKDAVKQLLSKFGFQ